MLRRKAEVMNLLETAGFSCANPYYVVQQGKVRGLLLWGESLRVFILCAASLKTHAEEEKTGQTCSHTSSLREITRDHPTRFFPSFRCS